MVAKMENTATMISAALVTTPALDATPSTTAPQLPCPRSPRSGARRPYPAWQAGSCLAGSPARCQRPCVLRLRPAAP